MPDGAEPAEDEAHDQGATARRQAERQSADRDGEQAHEPADQDPETEEDVAAHLHNLFIPDFSNWQNDGPFLSAWRRLLSDLGVD